MTYLWCWGPGSNRRPPPLQGDALPTELPQQIPHRAATKTFRVTTKFGPLMVPYFTDAYSLIF